jgi:hypothetical protein
MIAAVTQSLAGNEASAKGWAANVRERNPGLTRADFFSSFPVRPPEIRVRVAAALEGLGF